MQPIKQSVEAILSFWFAPENKPFWFAKSDAFDDAIRQQFANLYTDVRTSPDACIDGPRNVLAHIILLDQFPRNMFRGSPRMFESDDIALRISKQGIEEKLDVGLEAEPRVFFYMPLMHSEELADQEKGLHLFKALGRAENIDFMQRHYNIIKRYGRFPYRNAVLGRTNTDEEKKFLLLPGSGF